MIFRFGMFPAWSAVRSASLKLRTRHARPHQFISTAWLNSLVLVFLFWAILPLRAQNDLAVRASELMRTGKFHEAELLWRQLERQHPKDALIHGNLGVALAQQGKLEAATAEYRKSLALKPEQSDVVFNMGIAEFKQGHFSAAIPAFELFAKEKP
jgi:tetratricopeptide (TPR) repeat protein